MARLRKTGDDVGERDRLIMAVAEVGGEILQRKGGELAEVVWELGGELLAPHIDKERFFWETAQDRPVCTVGTDRQGRRAGRCWSRR
ncbi:unnamed protein product [Laminaria digitata]